MLPLGGHGLDLQKTQSRPGSTPVRSGRLQGSKINYSEILVVRIAGAGKCTAVLTCAYYETTAAASTTDRIPLITAPNATILAVQLDAM